VALLHRARRRPGRQQRRKRPIRYAPLFPVVPVTPPVLPTVAIEWKAVERRTEWEAYQRSSEWTAQRRKTEWRMGLPVTNNSYVGEIRYFDFDFGPQQEIAVGLQTLSSIAEFSVDSANGIVFSVDAAGTQVITPTNPPGLPANLPTITGNKVFFWGNLVNAVQNGRTMIRVRVKTSGGATLKEQGVLAIN